jgi:hypothetical protein
MENLTKEFTCTTFNMPIPIERQVGFCAKKFRMGDRFCKQCDTGKAAAKTDAETVRAGLLNSKQGQRLPEAVVLSAPVVTPREEKIEMAERKLCTCPGKCGKLAVKDGLSTKCYKAKHGVLPFAKAAKAGDRTKPEKRAPRKNQHDHGSNGGCKNCLELTRQANEFLMIQNVLIGVGLVSGTHIAKAREFVQSMPITLELAERT